MDALIKNVNFTKKETPSSAMGVIGENQILELFSAIDVNVVKLDFLRRAFLSLKDSTSDELTQKLWRFYAQMFPLEEVLDF